LLDIVGENDEQEAMEKVLARISSLEEQQGLRGASVEQNQQEEDSYHEVRARSCCM